MEEIRAEMAQRSAKRAKWRVRRIQTRSFAGPPIMRGDGLTPAPTRANADLNRVSAHGPDPAASPAGQA